MLYSPRARILGMYPHPTQEEIRGCPNFLPSRPEFVLEHPSTPDFLKRVVKNIPWTNTRKHKLALVRTALVNKDVGMTGCFWHIDVAGETADSSVFYDDLILWLITFGQVNGEALGGTEFITSALELPELDFSNPDYLGFAHSVQSKTFESIIVPNGQLVNYSTYDVHRGLFCGRELSGYRLTLICGESDYIKPVDIEKDKLSAWVSRTKIPS